MEELNRALRDITGKPLKTNIPSLNKEKLSNVELDYLFNCFEMSASDF